VTAGRHERRISGGTTGIKRGAAFACERRRTAVSAFICALLGAVVVFAAPAAATQYHFYFGDLHNHTADSDGSGTPAQAYAAARAAGADYLAVTDHTDWDWPLGDARWQAQRAAAAAATTSHFAALNGYEVTMPWGHVNVYDPVAMPTDAEAEALENGTPASLYDWLVLHPGSVAQWNHPTWKSNEFDGFAYLTPERRAAVAAIEVMNEVFTYEASYTSALDRGWLVMPTANSDTHKPDWIVGRPQRTVLLAEQLTPPALLEALRARRGYATAVPDLRVSFRGNGEIMGSTLPRPAKISFTVRVTDPKPRRGAHLLRWVALVSDKGRVVAKKKCRGYSVDWRPTLRVMRAVPGGAHYFFLRVTNASGRAAWTAPIWTGLSVTSTR
jgi:hypothetical protein